MFTIPNAANAAFPDQAAPDARDFDILAAGDFGYGVYSGCAVTATGTNLVLTVAAGSVAFGNGTPVAVAGNTVTVAAADATNPRYDIVGIGTNGVAILVAGTAASAPVLPGFSLTTVVAIAAVYVPAAATTLATGNIVDKRVGVGPGPSNMVTTDTAQNISAIKTFLNMLIMNANQMIRFDPAGVPADLGIAVSGVGACLSTSSPFRAVGGLFEGSTDAAKVRVYSVNNPPPAAASSFASINKFATD